MTLLTFLLVSLFYKTDRFNDTILPNVRSVIDHRRRRDVVRASVTHSAIASCAYFFGSFYNFLNVISDLLLKRRTVIWTLHVKLYILYSFMYAVGFEQKYHLLLVDISFGF